MKDISGLDSDDGSENKVKLIESRYLEGCQGAFGMDWMWKGKGGRG